MLTDIMRRHAEVYHVPCLLSSETPREVVTAICWASSELDHSVQFPVSNDSNNDTASVCIGSQFTHQSRIFTSHIFNNVITGMDKSGNSSAGGAIEAT